MERIIVFKLFIFLLLIFVAVAGFFLDLVTLVNRLIYYGSVDECQEVRLTSILTAAVSGSDNDSPFPKLRSDGHSDCTTSKLDGGRDGTTADADAAPAADSDSLAATGSTTNGESRS